MKSISLWLFAALLGSGLTGCASKPVAPTATPAVPAATKESSGWARYELPTRGISALFPTAPRLRKHGSPQKDAYLEFRQLIAEHEGMTYELSTIEVYRDNKLVLQDESALGHFDSLFKNITSRRALTAGNYSGVELRGTTKQDTPRLVRVQLLGNTVVSWAVDGKKEDFDSEKARRFIDDSTIELPWHVYSAPDGQFSISVPTVAAELPRSQFGWGPEFSGGAGFYLGGSNEIFYAAGSMILASDDPRSADEVADAMVEAMGTRGKVLYSGPLDYEGARGRDVLTVVDESYFHVRVVVTKQYGFLLMVGGKDRESVLDNAQQRFFSSLRWYDTAM